MISDVLTVLSTNFYNLDNKELLEGTILQNNDALHALYKTSIDRHQAKLFFFPVESSGNVQYAASMDSLMIFLPYYGYSLIASNPTSADIIGLDPTALSAGVEISQIPILYKTYKYYFARHL